MELTKEDFDKLLAPVKEAANTSKAGFDSVAATLNDIQKYVKTIVVKPEDVKNAEEVAAEKVAALEDSAKMEDARGMLGNITSFEVWDIPVGQAVIGGFVAVITSELVDGFLAAQSTTIKGVVKLVAAGAVVKFGSKLLGSTGSKAVAILLAYDGIRMLLPIDEYANKFAGQLTKLTGKGLGGRAGMGGGIVANSGGDYYSNMFKR